MLNTRYMAIDYGDRRVGVALSDELKIIPSKSFVIINSNKLIDDILEVAKNNNVSKIIVGLPLTLKNKISEQTIKVSNFTKILSSSTQIKIVLWDERLTSKMAHTTLQQIGAKKKEREKKSNIDELAARFILQSYLDCKK
ncbi:MAG: Holliday junction resolvase RuvX [Bacteroidetes bacterium]|nr:Holliday junction resolvase RuvX [Bacteroidota bacterium]